MILGMNACRTNGRFWHMKWKLAVQRVDVLAREMEVFRVRVDALPSGIRALNLKRVVIPPETNAARNGAGLGD